VQSSSYFSQGDTFHGDIRITSFREFLERPRRFHKHLQTGASKYSTFKWDGALTSARIEAEANVFVKRTPLGLTISAFLDNKAFMIV
jgi:hypothetical protein